MKLLRLAPAKFLHFGTTREIIDLMTRDVLSYEHLGWSAQVNSSIAQENIAGYCSVLSNRAQCGEHCYLEVSYVQAGARIRTNTIITHVDIADVEIPSYVFLHGLKQQNGTFVVRIYDASVSLGLSSAP